MKCRFCSCEITVRLVDLGHAPPSNAFISIEKKFDSETYFPLDVGVCDKCFLVQVDEYQNHSEIFNENYVYFSSFSSSWLTHCREYVDYISERLALGEKSIVCEVASNDGYLLQFFKNKGIPCFGVEPTSSTAEIAIEKGIKTYKEFFGVKFSEKIKEKVDLILGNNVYAHVPDINDFTAGLEAMLKDDGVVTLEFPHLYQLIKGKQFDTIYHEHFSYLSLITVKQIFEKHNLELFDVDQIPTHGGSLRIYGKKKKSTRFKVTNRVLEVMELETSNGLGSVDGYKDFQEVCFKVKLDFLEFLLNAKKSGKKVAAYGAAAKGNTLLNYCGVKSDMIDFVCDKSPYKQNMLLPGSRIRVCGPETIKQEMPDFIVIFPWNLKVEITEQLAYVRDWGAKFVVAIPELEIF